MSDPPPPFEYQKWVHELGRADAHRAHDSIMDFAHKINAAGLSYAGTTIKSLLLINGGAAVAMLGFIGALVGRGIDFGKIAPITQSLGWFAWGVAGAVVASGTSYLTNYCYATDLAQRTKKYDHPFVSENSRSKGWKWTAFVFHGSTLIIAIGSMLFFIWGFQAVEAAVAALHQQGG